MNNFFEITPDNYLEVHEKWIELTDEEFETIANSAKSRIFVSVADINHIQDAFESSVANGFLSKPDERRIMQMGYALEEIKQKLIKDIQSGKKKGKS